MCLFVFCTIRAISDLNVYDSALKRLVEMQQERHDDVSNVLIGGDLLYMPWSHSSGVQWNSVRKHKFPKEIDNVTSQTNTSTINTNTMTSVRTTAASLADLTLYPAPGEHLSIRVTVMDDVLTPKTSSLVMQVRVVHISRDFHKYRTN